MLTPRYGTSRKGSSSSFDLRKNKHRSTGSVCSVSTDSSLGFDRYATEALPLDFEVPMLGPSHVSEILKCNGFEPGQAKKHYDHVALNWEAIYLRLGYPDPRKVAEKVEKYAKLRGLDKATCKILDVACGTGLIGKYLAEKGFKNISGLDISPNMLDQARSKKVYDELLEHDIDEIGEFPPRWNNAFDFVVGSGIVNSNNMDERLFETFMRGCKKDGNIIFASRFSYIGDYWYDEAVE